MSGERGTGFWYTSSAKAVLLLESPSRRGPSGLVAGRVLDGWHDKGKTTTISAGVALHEGDTTSQRTFERADRALYQAKAAGKNRAQLWVEPGDDASSHTPPA